MRNIMLVIVMLSFGVIAGEDAISKAVADRNATVAKAKEIFDKATTAADAKLVADLKLALKRTGADKVAIAAEIVKFAPNDSDALGILEKEGKLADIGRNIQRDAEVPQGLAVYKVWNDKGKLDYAGSGSVDTVGAGERLNENLGYKFGTVKAFIEITTAGEYKVQAANYEGSISVTFAGRKVDWSKPTILPLGKGKYPLVVELNRPRSWSIKFAAKADASMDPLTAPYLATDPAAMTEAEKDPKFKAAVKK